ncbi:MAG TPA: hypothetical protein VHB72_01730 [Candidatus Saccharimonadales bacterium]|nr:hypothetical protein [Candidatus Saccharimonadales bacterium]
MMKYLVGYTKNRIAVYVDLTNSQAAPHVAAHPYLLGLAKDALSEVTAKEERLKFEQNAGRPIGYENVVETSPGENVIYAQLVKDDLYSRFTRKGVPKRTNYVSLVIERQGMEYYLLTDAWIGRLKPPRPGSPHETPASRQYWATHAFLLDTQVMQKHSRTEVCPY